MCKTQTNLVHRPLNNEITDSSSSTAVSNTKKPSSITRAVTLLFAAACGISVANIYFAQPLLDQLSEAFGINHSTIGIVITITQIFFTD